MIAQPCQIGILFADVAGSTRLYEAYGDAVAHAAVQGALTLMTECVLRAGGVVVKTVGDEVMAAFFRAEPMIDAAIEMQRAAGRQPALTTDERSGRVHLRIGMHFGPALRAGADYFGQTVNAAARLVSIAKADEIIVAMDLGEGLEGDRGNLFRPLDSLSLRGISEEIHIAELVWHRTSQLTELPDQFRASAPTAGTQKLALHCAGTDWLLDPRDPPFLIGRDPENTLCIADPRVSRRHATIERRLASWVFLDQSSNGSFLTFDGGQELFLRRHEMTLHAAGLVSLGQSSTQPGIPPLTFRLIQA